MSPGIVAEFEHTTGSMTPPTALTKRRLPRVSPLDDAPLDSTPETDTGGLWSRGARPADLAPSASKPLSVFVILFLIGLLIPWEIYVGPMRLSGYRLVLLIATLPCLMMWISGRAGSIRLPDIAVLLYCGWGAISLIVLHGFSAAWQPSGILFIETAGAYLLARCLIRTPDDFYQMAKVLFWIVVALLPFALIETLTHVNIAMKLFSSVMPSYPISEAEARWGLRRVQTVFEHPILYGVCASSAVAMAFLVLGYGQPLVQRAFKAGLVAFAAFLSLSAGPITAAFAQLGLVGWDTVLKSNPYRWRLLLLGVAAMWLLISAVSNQSVPAFYITHFSFDPASAYFRILIWEFGTNSVAHNPLFGTGLGEWLRPDWMPPSIDMFWLTHAVYYGLPAALLMGLVFASSFVSVALKTGLSDRVLAYRTAYLICMTGYFLVGWTVHFWNASYALFIFLIGSGLWVLDYKETRSTNRKDRTSEATRTDSFAPIPFRGHDRSAQ